MKIVIEKVPPRRYQGTLYIDDEVVETVFEQRPGCAARKLLNMIYMKYGQPSGEIVLDVDGW